MSFDIVLVTSATRPTLFTQTVESLVANAAVPGSNNSLVVIMDGRSTPVAAAAGVTIKTTKSVGASAVRNIGAGSIPKYRRQQYVMFIDDDVYMVPGWDIALETALAQYPGAVISGYSHRFNQPLGSYHRVKSAGVLSTVHMAMHWDIWDDVGYFVEPGGPGGSEDVEWCARASAKGYGLAVTEPQCAIHCGLTSSAGEPIVGRDVMLEQNNNLLESYGLAGKVRMV